MYFTNPIMSPCVLAVYYVIVGRYQAFTVKTPRARGPRPKGQNLVLWCEGGV
jgi:hypothetical protein